MRDADRDVEQRAADDAAAPTSGAAAVISHQPHRLVPAGSERDQPGDQPESGEDRDAPAASADRAARTSAPAPPAGSAASAAASDRGSDAGRRDPGAIVAGRSPPPSSRRAVVRIGGRQPSQESRSPAFQPKRQQPAGQGDRRAPAASRASAGRAPITSSTRQPLRPGQLQRHPARRARPKHPRHRLGDIVELDDVEPPGVGKARQRSARRRGRGTGRCRHKPAARRTTEGRRITQSSALASSSRVALLLGAQELGRAAAAPRPAPTSGRPASRPAASQARHKRRRRVAMDRGGGIARAVLKHAGAIHHRVDPGEMRRPVAPAASPCECRAAPSAPPAPAAPPRRARARRRSPHGPRPQPRRDRRLRSARSRPAAARVGRPPPCAQA